MEEYEKILQSAETVFNLNDYTSTTILYFKTTFIVIDIIIKKRIGRTPKDHTERFRILGKEFDEYYKRLDNIFSVYRDTYTKSISLEVCKEIQHETGYFIKELKKRG